VNLLEARVVLRPRSLSDILDLAAPFCAVNPRVMLPLALVTSALGGALAVLARGLGWAWPVVWLLVATYTSLSKGLFTQAAGELLFRPPAEVSPGGVAARFLRQLPRYLMARALQALLLLLSALAVLPLPVVAARLLFVGEAVLLESGSPMAALSRSRSLVRWRSWPGFALALACVFAPVFLAAAADVAGDAVVNLVFEMGRPLGSLWTSGGSGFAVLGVLLSAPLVASASFLGYVDLRTRKEGWDIQLRFMALAQARKDTRIA
jgi:hypothetical protein